MNVYQLFKILCLILIVLMAHQSQAAILLEDAQTSQKLGDEIFYFVETSPLNIEQALALDNKYQRAEGPVPNFGIAKSVYWFRISIDYTKKGDGDDLRYIQLDYPHLDHVEFYGHNKEGEMTKIVTGDSYPFSHRPIASESFVFETYLNPSARNDLYFRVSTSTSLQMPLQIWQPKAYIQHASVSRMGYGLYYGAILVMFLYNLFVYLSVRDRSYLYYIFYISAVYTAHMSVDGLAFEIFWPNSPLFANYSLSFSLVLAVLTAVLFAREYLCTKQFSPRWDFASKLFLGIATLGFIPSLLGNVSTALLTSVFLMLVMGLFLLCLSAYGMYRKQRRAYFFFAAWAALCIGSLMRALVLFDVLPTNFVTIHGVHIGVFVELVLLSFALADRMKQDRSDKLLAIKESLQASEQALQANEEKRKFQQQLVQQSLYERLTGSPNRVLFREQLQTYIDQFNPDQKNIVSVCIHLNNFHDINNTLGHDTGDKLLIEFVNKLEQEVANWPYIEPIKHEDLQPKFVAIIEGVYLALIFSHSKSDNIDTSIERLLAMLDAPIKFNNMVLTIGGQVGMAIWPSHGADAETILRKSKIAVRSVKPSRLPFATYEASIDERHIERLSLAAELKTAIAESQLELYYQPKVSLDTNRVISLEALVRWNHPKYGLLGPDRFVDFAENTGVIQPLTQWILNEGMGFCQELQSSGYDLSVAINVSARNLLEEDFVSRVNQLINKYKLAPENLSLEVVESSMIEDMEFTIGTLNQLAKLGAKLSIDDFGTGYSSLEYLKKLPVQELKIDRSFVTDMVNNPDDKLIVNTTLTIAHQLGMKVVAEGIENADTLFLLHKMGCDIGQGYFISRPIPKLEVLVFLKNQSNE